jgi:hypothetical protein
MDNKIKQSFFQKYFTSYKLQVQKSISFKEQSNAKKRVKQHEEDNIITQRKELDNVKES